MHCPFDYSLCNRTVTVYRKAGQDIQRQVVKGCYLEYSTRIDRDEFGAQVKRPFVLIVPGQAQRVFADDRIFDGVGPQVTAAQWQGFIPANDPRVMQVQYVQPCYWEGRLCHVEAGRKSAMFSY